MREHVWPIIVALLVLAAFIGVGTMEFDAIQQAQEEAEAP